MRFHATDNFPQAAQPNAFYLLRDNWNDWWEFKCMRTLIHVDDAGRAVVIGKVKIGRVGMVAIPGTALEVELPAEFDALGSDYFSLGQSENFYESLDELGADVRVAALIALRDCALDLALLQARRAEPTMFRSLLRDVSESTVASKYHALALGRIHATPFSFEYQLPTAADGTIGPLMRFDVAPESMPPTNVHVLIGRNGVGKSRSFNLLARALVGDEPEQSVGRVSELNRSASPWAGATRPFSGICFVAFSAFDEFKPLDRDEYPSGMKYAYVGLKRRSEPNDQDTPSELKSQSEIFDEFLRAARACREGARMRRWLEVLTVLESDPLFAEQELTDTVGHSLSSGQDGDLFRYFNRLSSGHRIVLLIASKLVEIVEEKTLVLIDEPEGHLHPPLLSALIRALSVLLGNRNGVAIVATHSPVVLQEVPRSCVWVLNRTGPYSRVDRPGLETFGENVGVLTRDVFSLETLKAGFVELLASRAESVGWNYAALVESFSGHIGAEGRSIARAICSNRGPVDD